MLSKLNITYRGKRITNNWEFLKIILVKIIELVVNSLIVLGLWYIVMHQALPTLDFFQAVALFILSRVLFLEDYITFFVKNHK